MVLESRIAIVRQAFNIRTLEDWTRITPAQVIALDEVGQATLDHVRLYLAGRNVTLRDDQTVEYWQQHLGEAAICHEMTEGEKSDVLPFTIIVDNLEKHPFTFDGIQNSRGRTWIVPTESKRLPVNMGDYQVKGIDDITVERKSIWDLFSTLGDRESFKQQCIEMEFMMRAAFIVIESSWWEIREPHKFIPDWRSKLSPNAVWSTINSWRQKYPRVHWIAAGDRRLAEITTFDLLRMAWKNSQQNSI